VSDGSDGYDGRDDDPILAQRARIARWVAVAQRIGYALFAISMVAVVAAIATDLPDWLLSIATWSLLGGCIVLAPAIIVAYTVKAAEREDRERGL
jgi:hypothetical protein